MRNQSKIEQQVMASVAVVYTARTLTSRFAFECYAFVLSFAGAAYFVSLPNVAANLLQVAQGGLPSIGTFFVGAVLGTKLVVQVALAIGIFSLGLIALDLIRSNSISSRHLA